MNTHIGKTFKIDIKKKKQENNTKSTISSTAGLYMYTHFYAKIWQL